MTAFKLTYFDFSASRGEECRLALHLANVPFEDERVKSDDWPAVRARTPYGSLPVLTIEGKGQLAQSNAILRYIGATHGLHPSDPFEAARHESVMGAVEDMRVRAGPINRIKDVDEKRKARQELATGYLQEWGAGIERQIVGPFVGGAAIGVADLKLFVAVGTYLKGGIDFIPSDVFKAFPKLLRLVDAVQHHPKVQEWYARH